MINNILIRLWRGLIKFHLTDVISDSLFLKITYYLRTGRKLNITQPERYNEKLQWLKINDKNPLYTNLVDKASVKDIVSNTIGKQYIVPTLGTWSNVNQIDFNDLPEKFVLKCTHDSGGIVICEDKNTFDYSLAEKVLNKSLKYRYYAYGREWPYKKVTPQIIAEPFLEDSKTKELRDYKFFCFNGKAEYMFIAANRQSSDIETTFDFYDMDFNHLDIINGHPNSSVPLDKPLNFDLMKNLAEILSEGIPHVRIDFYEVNGQVFFGEYTFYHYSGFTPFVPDEWDYILGKHLDIWDIHK